MPDTPTDETINRVAIIGSGGAGKSTFARELGEILGVTPTHLDVHYWRPGWQETPRDEWTEVQKNLLAGERWIVDGDYGGTMDLRLSAADTVIFLDMPRLLCVWRVLKRVVTYRKSARPDMAPGCRERLNWPFLAFVWNYPRKRRPEVLRRLEHHAPAKTVVRLETPRQVRRFLASLK